MISGSSAATLDAREQRLMRSVMLNSAMFILGFSIVFIALGAGATALGQVVGRFRRDLTMVAGIVIIIFGLHLIGVFKIKALYMDKRIHDVKPGTSPLSAFFVGFAFAFGWTPCIGPILAGILTLAAAEETVMKGMGLLAIYSLGLAVPFLLTSLGIDRFLSFYGKFRRHLHTVEVVSGALLIAIGALVLTGRFTVLSGYLSFLNKFAL